MSQVKLQGNASGTGSVTLLSPNTNGDYTVTLPAVTGTAVLQNASNNLLMNSGYGSDAVAYGCRSWVNFKGTGTVAIRGSGNVSSITDNGAGNYTVNFSTAMTDTNYAVVAGNGNNSVTNSQFGNVTNVNSTTQVDIIHYENGSATDVPQLCVLVFR